MSGIKNYSTTAVNNVSAVPDGWPSGMNPADVKLTARQMMADTRSWYESPEFRDLGHTPTYASASSFTIPTDVTSYYIENQRIRIADSSTLYGTIASSSYSAPNTTVNVTLDSGSISASISAVAVGASPAGNPISASAVKGLSNEFADNVFRVTGSSDATKKLAFEVSGISTATTRTLTVTDTSLSIPASAAGPSSIVLAEATDNGANTVSIKSPTAVTSDRIQTLQDSSGVLALTSNAGVSVSGLIIQNNSGTPNTRIDISANDVVMGDTSGNTVRSINVSVTINAATTGANGLDAGSLSNSTWYYLWLISNGTTTSGLVSASSTAPTMPSGYTYKKRVGSFITDGSATFKRISQRGSYASYVPTATTNTTSYPTYGASPVSIYSLVPPTCELACITNNQAQGSSSPWSLNTSPNNTQLVSGGAWTGVGFAANSVTWFVPVQSTMAYSGAAPLAVGWKDSV